jgi:hypothetical protein
MTNDYRLGRILERFDQVRALIPRIVDAWIDGVMDNRGNGRFLREIYDPAPFFSAMVAARGYAVLVAEQSISKPEFNGMAAQDFILSHYAAAFIDLLGQRAQLRGQDLLPADRDEAIRIARKSIGDVRWLHDRLDTFYTALTKDPFDGDKMFDHPKAKEMRSVDLKFQRFSDGLLMYVSLFGQARPEIINGLYGLIVASGSLCLLGLAEKRPIRGGISVAWGAELNDNELYGAVIARAYELESEKERYPRIVVGEHVAGYLQSVDEITGDDLPVKYCRALAQVTLSFLGRDADGLRIVDYLGPGFRKHISKTLKEEDYRAALEYIAEQSEQWHASGNGKLADRYEELGAYFAKNGFK